MKHVITWLTAIVLFSTIAAEAQAQQTAKQQTVGLQSGTYAIVEGGVNFTGPTNTLNGFTSVSERIKVKSGWALSAAGGYKWSNRLRTELELSYHRSSFKNRNESTDPLTGRQVTATIMANVLYDVHTGTRITPFIGAGIGGTMAWVKRFRQVNSNITAFLNDDSIKLAYQGIIGVAVAIAPQWEGLVDARYRVSDGHGFVNAVNSLTKYNIRETTVMAGIRYAF